MARRRAQLRLNMIVATTPDEVRALSRNERSQGRRIALVPTMGALHQGHLELVRTARTLCDTVFMSIYVNPKQFNVAADFEKYPRTLETDLVLARDAGVDVVYAPGHAAMYPDGFDTTVHVGATAAALEGAGRPGHFDGVATVVTKLLLACEPDTAVFGQKDYQQLAVITRLVRDLDMPVAIVGAPTVRESDGLAMSSRNTRLAPEQRAAAPVVKKALDAAAGALSSDGDCDKAREAFRALVASEPLAHVEYVSIADAGSLQEQDNMTGPVVISCAVWFGDVRLIDNVVHVP